MMHQGKVIQFITEAYKHCKPIAASGEAVALFRKANLVGANIAAADEQNVVSHMGVITVSDTAQLADFAAQFKTALLQHRHWEREAYSQEVPA